MYGEIPHDGEISFFRLFKRGCSLKMYMEKKLSKISINISCDLEIRTFLINITCRRLFFWVIRWNYRFFIKNQTSRTLFENEPLILFFSNKSLFLEYKLKRTCGFVSFEYNIIQGIKESMNISWATTKKQENTASRRHV